MKLLRTFVTYMAFSLFATPPAVTGQGVPTVTPQLCVGDCNYSGGVTVDEVLTTVNIALGNADVSTCRTGDANHDDEVTIDEILTAVGNALNGCPAVPTPSDTPSLTNTSTATASSTPTTTPTWTPVTDAALACQRAIESGGIAYAREVLQATDDCAATGQGGSAYDCLASASVAPRLAELRAQWAVDAGAVCAATDLQHDLGYAEVCGAPPSTCTLASVGVGGVLDCLACQIGEYLQGAAAKLYADRLDAGGCRGALGAGMREVRATLEQLHECVSRPGATSVAACFTPNLAEWRAQAEISCSGVDAFGSLGYPRLCSGKEPISPSVCAEHALPCTFSSTSSLSVAGGDNDLIDCLTCQAEEAALGVARDLYGANLCCIGGMCKSILTRFVCREAGGTPVRYHVDSLRLTAPISAPHGIQVGPDGFLYLIDTSIKKVNRDTGRVTVLANPGWGTGVAIDSAGNVYFTQRCDHRVSKMTPWGAVSVVAGTGVAGHSGDEGPATAAQIAAPDGITLDAAGNVYFTESGLLATFCGAPRRGSERVRMVDTSGVIHTVAGGDGYGIRGEGGPAVGAALSLPYSLRFAVDGSLLVGEDGAMRVLRIAGGIINRIAGRAQGLFAAHSGYGGPALGARFYHTCGLTEDLDGNVIVGAMEDNRLALVDRLGSVTGIAGTGEGGIREQVNGDDGPAALAQGFCCEDISVAADGRIYCSDIGINRIRVLTREPF